MFATLILTCLGMSLVLLGSGATALAARDWRAAAAVRAAEGAVSLAIADLRERTDWSGVLAAGGTSEVCAEPGRFVDSSLLPPSPSDGRPIDLRSLTAQLQAASDSAARGAGPWPVWRLLEYGPISRLVPADPGRHPLYLAVWAADGGDGVVVLRGTAFGPASVRASVEASIARPAVGGPAVRLATRTVR